MKILNQILGKYAQMIFLNLFGVTIQVERLDKDKMVGWMDRIDLIIQEEARWKGGRLDNARHISHIRQDRIQRWIDMDVDIDIDLNPA